MVGARSLAMGAQPADRRRHRRAQPAHRHARAAGGPLSGPGRRSSALASLALFLVAVWQLDPIVRWLWPIPVAGVRDLPVPEALHLALAPLARRRRRARAGRRLGRDHGRAAAGGLAARRRGRVLGRRLRLFYALLDVDFDRREGLHSVATRSANGARSGARASCTWPRSACWSGPGSGSTSASSTGSASPLSPSCSSTSTRSCARETCGGSTRRSSRERDHQRDLLRFVLLDAIVS